MGDQIGSAPGLENQLALVYAVSENPRNPVISLAGLTWARKFVEHLTCEMLYHAQFWIAEGWFDRLKKRMLAMLQERGGSATRSELMNSLRANSTTFDLLLRTLIQCNKIELEQLNRHKLMISLKDERLDD